MYQLSRFVVVTVAPSQGVNGINLEVDLYITDSVEGVFLQFVVLGFKKHTTALCLDSICACATSQSHSVFYLLSSKPTLFAK